MKIIELLIDDLEGGVDGIALVEKPAHESNFLMFSDDEELVIKYLGDFFTPEQQLELAEIFGLMGQEENELLAEGYEIVSVKPVVFAHENFAKGEVRQSVSTPSGNIRIISDPNEYSGEDVLGGPLVRYKYVGPRDSKNRDFCRVMLEQNRVYRKEDIDAMTLAEANPEFGQYDIFQWRGSYNCRHLWVQITYQPKEGERILNDAAIRRGVTGTNDIPQESTTTRSTANDAEQREGVQGQPGGSIADLLGLGTTAGLLERIRRGFSIVDIIDGVPVFDNEADALKMSEKIGCVGTHKHEMGWMPCEGHTTAVEFESYNDYPEAAKENACKVLRWIDEHGRDEVQGMTQTGLARANQLCSGENISVDTIARMAAFERHRQNSEISEENKGTPWKDKGYVSWLGWGGDEGIAWAQRKLEQVREDFEIDACWPGYEAVGFKIKDGKRVPNCVPKNDFDYDVSGLSPYVSQTGATPVQESVYKFNYDEEKQEITGAAVIPNKFIIRRSPFGEFYYVYFSEETTKKLAERFMKNKFVDSTNIEHTDTKADDTYVTESWIVDDPENDKIKALGLDFPKGTWMITMKVDNPTIWSEIKQGKYKGFSVEGYFMEKLIFSSINK